MSDDDGLLLILFVVMMAGYFIFQDFFLKYPGVLSLAALGMVLFKLFDR